MAPNETADGARRTSFLARPTARGTRWVLRIALSVVAVLLLAANAFAYDVHRFRGSYDGRILPGATIQGVDVSGMERAEAIAAVEERLAPRLDRRVTLRWQQHTWSASPRELGATTDVAEQVDAALDATAATGWLTLAGVRWLGEHVTFAADVSIEVPRRAVAERVREVGDAVDLEPVDASLGHDRERLWIEPERDGRRVDPVQTTDAWFAALGDPDGPSEVRATVQDLEPEVRASDHRQVLFLRQSDHRLDLYLDGRLADSYVVATGTNDYPTPTGVYEVSLKRHRPTWVNPAPSGWGRGLPARIGPGPNNPLGLRALNWSAPGAIRFHGTAAVDTLGRDASHGCVRLSNDDIVQLYDLVDEGATILSIR